MSRDKIPLVPFHEMNPGQRADFFVRLVERTRGLTRDNKPFYTCRFTDSKRTATYMVWADSENFTACEQEWKEGRFFKIRGVYQEHKQYGPQIDVEKIRLVHEGDLEQGFDPGDLVEKSRFEAEEMFAELRQLAEQRIGNAPLQKLVLTILDRHAYALMHLPATQRHFYPFHGGLVEHTLSVTRSSLHLAEKYARHYPEAQPPINVDLVVAGAILHDIGRVLEFEDALTAAVEPTIPGRLFGHLFLGRDLVRDTARELDDVDPELLRLLEHLIISHLNLPEWGSPRLPLIPESLIIHHADDLDAKMEMYMRCLRRDQEAGPFTARDPVLGRQLLKRRKQ